MNRLRIVSVGLAVLLLTAFLQPVAPASAEQLKTNSVTPVHGTFTDKHGRPGTFNGQFTLEKLEMHQGQLVAKGRLTGQIQDSDGTRNIDGNGKDVRLPLGFEAPTTGPTAAAPSAPTSCQILDLVINPISLDLLGLVVTLDRVHLNITAVPGMGNLLGNLLCSLAGLLDQGSPLSNLINAIIDFLNAILT